MQRHRVRHVEADDLGNDFRALGDAKGGETIAARQRVERRLENVTAGGAADAAVESHGGFLLDRMPAGLRIVALELAPQQGAKVRQLEFPKLIGVPLHGVSEGRQNRKHRHDLFDRCSKNGLNDRPRLRKNAPRPVIELVQPTTRFEGLQEIDRRHYLDIPDKAPRGAREWLLLR